MRVVALKAWSNGSVSMEERQIAELSDALATSLNAQGIVAPTALPEITDADDGKVLTANSGVWGAEFLDGSGRKLQIEATYSDGAYVTNTQITPDEYYRAVASGYTCELWIGSVASKLHLIADKYNDFAYYKATLQDGSNVGVVINGFDQEYLAINIFPYDNRFIVTLTPTEDFEYDFSLSSDKTAEEIKTAYDSGKEIWFDIHNNPNLSFDMAMANRVQKHVSGQYYRFYVSAIDIDNNVAIVISKTGNSADDTFANMAFYPLTPAT